MLARMLVNKILMDNGQLDRQLRQRDRVYKHNVLKDSYSMLSFPTSCFPGYPAPGGYVQGGVGQEVLVVGLQRVEVVVVGVAPGARPPAEPHLRHLGRHHRQVSLQVPAQQRHVSHCHVSHCHVSHVPSSSPVQQVRHDHAVAHHVYHELPDPGEKFGLPKCQK